MKHQRIFYFIVSILFLVGLAVLSGHPLEIGLLFLGAGLLRSQAGGLHTADFRSKLLFSLLLWIVGVISYSVVCPLWVLIPLLLMANATIYLFAPATSQEEESEEWRFLGWRKETAPWKTAEQPFELRRQKKNRAVFITLLLSVLAVAMRGKPISSLLLVILFMEMLSILGVIGKALREESNHIS